MKTRLLTKEDLNYWTQNLMTKQFDVFFDVHQAATDKYPATDFGEILFHLEVDEYKNLAWYEGVDLYTLENPYQP